LASLIKEARARGFSQTILGRRRPIRGLDIDRLAVNTPIQGSAADIIKLAMVGVAEEVSRKKLKAVLILQVHDELLFELPEKELEETCALIRPIMENVFPLSIPLKVNISWGNTWAELD
jgi:DNA polymerase-1